VGRAREVSATSVALFPHAPESVAAARGQISADLRAAGIGGPAIGDAALVVTELLSNAVLHARPLPGARVLVAWALRDASLEVGVSDGGGATRPGPRTPRCPRSAAAGSPSSSTCPPGGGSCRTTSGSRCGPSCLHIGRRNRRRKR
jgi:anti-sigma regulatory factor (Ser/Thr protein kinase)